MAALVSILKLTFGYSSNLKSSGRSVAYSPASTNSTHDARIAASLAELTSNALFQAGGTRSKRAAYSLDGSDLLPDPRSA